MYRNNFTLEQIALAKGKSMEEIDAVIKGREAGISIITNTEKADIVF